jgi:hypothetical protein
MSPYSIEVQFFTQFPSEFELINNPPLQLLQRIMLVNDEEVQVRHELGQV